MRLLRKLPEGLRLPLRRLRDRYRRWAARWRVSPPVGLVRYGSFRREHPISRAFGFDRGTPIDRYYIEDFLAAHASDVRGRVLEVGGDIYTRRFAGEHVTRSDVLHVMPGNPLATIVGSLETGEGLQGRQFDCLIITQTLHCIYDMHAAVRTLFGLLAPGGVALVSLPGISQISRYDADRWGDYWRLTPLAARRMFAEVFSHGKVETSAYGNAQTAAAFLYGLSIEDLPRASRHLRDADYPLVVCVWARRT